MFYINREQLPLKAGLEHSARRNTPSPDGARAQVWGPSEQSGFRPAGTEGSPASAGDRPLPPAPRAPRPAPQPHVLTDGNAASGPSPSSQKNKRQKHANFRGPVATGLGAVFQ